MEVPPIAIPAREVRSRTGRFMPWLYGVGAVVLVSVLWVSEPHGQVYYPRCLLHATTGLQCPGCGGLRAVHALLHGHLTTAWRLNPLLICYLPVFAWSGLVLIARRFGQRLPNPFAAPVMIGVLLGIAFVFGLVRNIPGFGPR